MAHVMLGASALPDTWPEVAIRDDEAEQQHDASAG